MVFTAAISWFVWIGLQGRRLAPQLAQTVQLDTTDTTYSSVLAMLAVLAIPIVGVWELFRTDEPFGTHEIRLLLVMIAGVLLAVAVFIQDYLANREFTSDVSRSPRPASPGDGVQQINRVGLGLDERTQHLVR